MVLNELKARSQEKMDKALLGLQNELKKIRTGRAQLDMLDGVKVNYYGQIVGVNQVAAVSTPDARSFLISPWESSILKELEQAIVKSDIGMAPINDGKVIRLKVPELTEARRKDLAKQAKKVAEDAKVGVRMIRRDANEEIKSLLKDKTISEDDGKRSETEIQKLTDDHIKKIDQIFSEKEKSIMTV
jgi:ribosome recycling factor